MIKTTFATVVLLIATTKATKLNDKTKPPNNPGRPDSFIIFNVFFYKLLKEKLLKLKGKKKILKIIFAKYLPLQKI